MGVLPIIFPFLRIVVVVARYLHRPVFDLSIKLIRRRKNEQLPS